MTLRERQRLLSRARGTASLAAQIDAVTLGEVNALAKKAFSQNPALVYTLNSSS